jgi:hypothetical protein
MWFAKRPFTIEEVAHGDGMWVGSAPALGNCAAPCLSSVECRSTEREISRDRKSGRLNLFVRDGVVVAAAWC